ncbi:MAG: hypothetical protein COB78_03805 [Hyphomicrobiales bacterium]|nr:MAG: hypothetical protein COB78_03805 [Hyphomicrobiales bacterium]
MSVVSFQTHYGGAATLGVGMRIPSVNYLNASAANQSSGSAGVIPSVSVGGSSGAIGKIIDIIANMDNPNSGGSENSVSNLAKNEKAKLERLEQHREWANLTEEDVIEQLKSGTYNSRSEGELNERSIAMRQALRDGTATVVDMEELGYRTEASFNVHFDSDGNHTGESVTMMRAGNTDIAKFIEENMIYHDDGTVTDRATGLNAGRVHKGGIELYVTWP